MKYVLKYNTQNLWYNINDQNLEYKIHNYNKYWNTIASVLGYFFKA